MDLELEINRPAEGLEFEVVRELVAGDLELLEGNKGTKAPPLVKRLSERHHALARNLAAGMKDQAAAAITGYVVTTVSILKTDPAFQELIKFYQSDIQAQYADLHENLAGLSKDALIVLRERLEETPEKISTAQLMDLTKMGADRVGHGPSQKTEVNVNVNLASRLEEARKRVAERRTIELKANED